MLQDPCLRGKVMVIQDEPAVRIGHPVLDRYLEFVEARARPNTVKATASDLRAFFRVVSKEPAEVTTSDVMGFITAQRRGDPRGNLVSLTGGGSGLSSRTIKRRLSLVSGLFAWMVLVGERAANPVPKGLATRRGRRVGGQRVPLVRTPITLPKVLDPAEVDALMRSLRSNRDRAMVQAMVLGGLRRSEVLRLRLSDLHPAEAKVFVADGEGGHERLVPITARFFRCLSAYFELERPSEAATEAVFVVLKGPHRGRALSDDGLEGVIRDARARAGLATLTCHQLRHTCLTRLREAGMALEALPALAGHRSIESTRIYLHLANEWLATEYLKAPLLYARGAPTCVSIVAGEQEVRRSLSFDEAIGSASDRLHTLLHTPVATPPRNAEFRPTNRLARWDPNDLRSRAWQTAAVRCGASTDRPRQSHGTSSGCRPVHCGRGAAERWKLRSIVRSLSSAVALGSTVHALCTGRCSGS